jgi:hypothetical protein
VNVSGPLNDISGREALLILRNYDNGEFIPIRFVVIDNVLQVGDINYVGFRARRYFPKTSRQRLTTIVEQKLVALGCQNIGRKSLGCLLFDVEIEGSMSNGTEEDEHSQWNTIVKEIGKLDCYKDFGFLRIVHVRDVNGRKPITSRDSTGEFSYQLKPDKVYFLEVVQHIPWDIDQTESIDVPYDVELKGEMDEITLLRRIQRVVGKYDLLRFIFKTPSTSVSKHSFLELENRQDKASTRYRLPALFIPVQIDVPNWIIFVKWVKGIVVAIGILTFCLSGFIAEWLQWNPSLIRDLALLSVIVASSKWDEFVTEFVKQPNVAIVQ